MRLMRLKDKLGNRSNATAEVEFDEAAAWLVGEPGRGIATILDMVTLTRLDCAVVSAGLMRLALAEAVHHVRHRKAFGLPLIDQPLMTRVLADMALDAVAAAALAFRLAESYDRAADDPAEAAFARLMTPAVKYWVTKIAPAHDRARRWSASAATATSRRAGCRASIARRRSMRSGRAPATSCAST